MDFLGIGPMELLVIIVIILIVFGPNRLPEMARTVGKAMKDIKNATTDLGKSLTSELEEEERRLKKDLKEVKADLSKSVSPAIEEAKGVPLSSMLPTAEEKADTANQKK